jgi:hypothetical protein
VWVHYTGWSDTTDEFLSRDELRARAPAWGAVDDIACEICASTEDEVTMVLCDCCDCGYHVGCLTPALAEIPKSQTWFCDKQICQRRGGVLSRRDSHPTGFRFATAAADPRGHSQKPVSPGQTIEYRFVNKSGGPVWWQGVVQSSAPKWPEWWKVRWQDGVYSVHMNHENYGSAWRHTDLGAAPWNKEMDAQLTDIVKSQGVGQWKRKADELGYGHSDIQVSKRWRHLCDAVAARCAACRKTQGEMLTCAGCGYVVHEHCLPPSADGPVDPSTAPWYCPQRLCQRHAGSVKRAREPPSGPAWGTLSVSHSISVLSGVFVWAHRALN